MLNFMRILLSASLILSLTSCWSEGAAVKTPRLKVKNAYAVKPDILAIHIETGKTIRGQQIPYKKHFGDDFSKERPNGDDWVKRGGQEIGALVGKNRNTLYTFDSYVDTPLDWSWADRRDSYRLVSDGDRNYSTSIKPESVFRKTKPTDMAKVSRAQYEWSSAHVLYLKLPAALSPGKTYKLLFPDGNIDNFSFLYQPQKTRSEAIHVSQLGFRSDDPAKVAFLSTWMGNGGGLNYPDGLSFWLIDEKTDRKVFAGKTQLSRARNEPEDPRHRNYNLTDVHLMDFSNFQRSGQYRACVDGIGCSFPFEIGKNTWRKAFFTSARGFYHQRSGIELSPPYTNVKRPRPFHPDDGVVVYQSTTTLMDVDAGIGKKNAFKSLIETKTNQRVPNAWGGYFDAGDWDRRIQHLETSRSFLELAELFPKYFRQLNLNIPESKNALPDIVDEALWGIDFFRRMQSPQGGIRGGIESAAHPRYGETSWQESLDVMAYAPDLWSSYIYAGVAARAAYWLEPRFPKQAAVYRNSALLAMKYAENAYAVSQAKELPQAVMSDRNLAAVELFRLTGEDKWHKIFLQTTVHQQPKGKEIFECQQCDAAFVYARIKNLKVDPLVKKNAVEALIGAANTSASLSSKTAFKWTKAHPYHPISWGTSLGAPKAVTLLRAHAITGKAEYLRASILACQFSAGANPNNMTFTTGLGYRSPQNPLVIDQRVMGQPALPGITVYGPLDPIQFGDFWTLKLLEDVTFPEPSKWPTTESYFDIYLFPPVTEFTVMQTMAPTAYAWGYLAARRSDSN